MMAISQAKRTELHQELREKLTVDTADTLMDHLPPDGWSEVAMKSDLRTLEVAMKSDLTSLEVVLKSEIAIRQAETKTDFAALSADVRTVQAEIKVLRGEMVALGASFNEALATAIAKQNKWMTGVLASLVVAMIIALMR
jgi:hypothetical protein